jgi:hypothetical protein
MSGPAVLQISNYWKKGVDVSINLLPGTDARELLASNAQSRKSLANFLSQVLPEKAARYLAPSHLADKPLIQMGHRELEQVGDRLNNWKVRFRDTEGYDKAEVTIGGISTDDLSSQTMETRNVKGLFFVGEVLPWHRNPERANDRQHSSRRRDLAVLDVADERLLDVDQPGELALVELRGSSSATDQLTPLRLEWQFGVVIEPELPDRARLVVHEAYVSTRPYTVG